MTFDWSAAGSISTTLAVLIAAWQVRRGRQQAITDFEDDLSREYRELARAIPVSVHLGVEVTNEEFNAIFSRLYQYIDLSNQQVFLRMSGRINENTWQQWADGIRSTMRQPAFSRAWTEVSSKAPNRFTELRLLEKSNYQEDPRDWVGRFARLRQAWSL
jgi:hypothetical protein